LPGGGSGVAERETALQNGQRPEYHQPHRDAPLRGGCATKFFQELLARAPLQDSTLAGNSGGQAGCQPAIQPIANRRYVAGRPVS